MRPVTIYNGEVEVHEAPATTNSGSASSSASSSPDGRVVTHEPSPLIEHYTPDSILRHFREFQARGCRDQTFHDNGPHMVESLLARLATVEAERDRLRGLLEELVDPDDCWFDHHGNCQAHGCAPAPCPQFRAKQELATRPPTPGDTPA